MLLLWSDMNLLHWTFFPFHMVFSCLVLALLSSTSIEYLAWCHHSKHGIIETHYNLTCFKMLCSSWVAWIALMDTYTQCKQHLWCLSHWREQAHWMQSSCRNWMMRMMRMMMIFHARHIFLLQDLACNETIVLWSKYSGAICIVSHG